MYKRIHNTYQDFISRQASYLFNEHDPFKPNGIWYGINKLWHKWCADENLNFLGPNDFILDIDAANILIISDATQLLGFIDKYGYNWLSSSFLSVNKIHWRIRWSNVVKDYKGIEIPNQQLITGGYKSPVWLEAWSTASGCLWDLTALKSATLITDKTIVYE